MSALAEDEVAALLRRAPLARLLDVLDGAGEETRIVGGAVRNALLGRPVSDVDLATTALPPVASARARAAGFKVVPTGIEHGTLTIVIEGTPFEVTTLREDVETDGRHAIVRFGRDFGVDARRRDFTINALSVDAGGRLHDYTGGLEDLSDRRVKFIGDAETRIREDYLRILRFFRFHAEYGLGELDQTGFGAAIRQRAGLGLLSRERIRAEFMKLLAAPRAAELVLALSDSGLLAMLLGGVGETGRLARVIASDLARGASDPVRRLAGLAVMAAEDADRLRDRLRLSNAEHDGLVAYAGALAGVRSPGEPLAETAVRRLAVEHGLDALATALAATDGEPRPVLSPDGRQAMARLESREEPVPEFPLRGGDLIGRGIAPGEDLGRRLAAARRRWLAEGCPTDGEARGRLIESALQA